MVNTWNAVDERCPYCNSIIKKTKGFNKQNLKNLCFSKPSLQDILIFIMLILCLIMFWSYSNEVGQYKFIYENPEEFCNSYFTQKLELQPIQGDPYELIINVSENKQNE